MLDIPSISAMIAATGVIVGVIFAVMELRNLVRARKTDLIVRLSPSFQMNGTELLHAWNTIANLQFKDYDDFVEKYGPAHDGTKPAQMAIQAIGNYFNGVGILLHRKLIDVNLVRDHFPTKLAWEKLEPIVKGFRRQYEWGDWLEYFEYLYLELQKQEPRPLQMRQ
jgi:hypothetical protein